MEHICYIIGAWHGEDACIRPREGDFVIAADGGYAALQALGYTPTEAARAVSLVRGQSDSANELVRLALRGMAGM